MIHKTANRFMTGTSKIYALRIQVIVILSVAKKKGKLKLVRRMNACRTQVCHYDKLHDMN